GCHAAAPTMRDGDVVDLDWFERPIVRVAAHARDLLHQGHARVVALSEERVAPIQAGIGNLGDEELRSVGVGAGICVSEASGAIELQVRRGFVFKLEADIATSATSWV